MKNLITILLIAVATTSCDISKPLLIESKEAIEAYSGDGIASYLEAPPFGVDGVAIIMSDFNMMNGLDIEYDLSGIPSGSPYLIYLTVPLETSEEDRLMDAILKGNWSYTIKKNGAAVKTVAGTLREMTDFHFNRWINSDTENEQIIGMNNFYYYSYGEETGLEVTDTNDNWSISVTLTNTILQEPVTAYINLQRGGSK